MAPDTEFSGKSLGQYLLLDPSTDTFELGITRAELSAPWTEDGVIRAFAHKYGDDPKAIAALIMITERYRIVGRNSWTTADHSVDHEKREIRIATGKGFVWSRTNANAAGQLYQVLADDFYGITDLDETWGGCGRRVAGGCGKVLGGGLSVVGGAGLVLAPEPTLTKVGGVGAVVFGANTVVDGFTQMGRREGGINLIGEAAGAYERALLGEESDEWYLRSRTWVGISGTIFELSSLGGFGAKNFMRTVPLRKLPKAARLALADAYKKLLVAPRGVVNVTEEASDNLGRWFARYADDGAETFSARLLKGTDELGVTGVPPG